MVSSRLAGFSVLAAAVVFQALALVGGVDEPVRFNGETKVDLLAHDAGLRPPVGAANYQAFRANRTHPEFADGCGWTYNHAPMLAYWNGKFYLEYLSNPVDEHIAPGQTLLTTSTDGRNWAKPEIVFPPYDPPPGTPMPEKANGYMMHQRMGFYVAPDGRLLVLAFYGHAENPFREGGIGRVAREAYKDGTFGPIYFVRYCSHTDWNETNTTYPFYKTSPDAGFVAACDSLLGNTLKTLQWYDEDCGLDGFYKIKEAGQAFNYYQRADGKIVGLWKRSLAALSEDGGLTFSKPSKCSTLVMAGGKQWGQRTEDGRYAILYNPTTYDEHRYPLIVITSDDGIAFDNMLVVHGEVPPRRFFGRWKDFGPCYVRGIVQGNGNPPGGDLWVTYSVNKEDMWVSRVPVPIRWRVETPVADNFEDMEPGSHVRGWNVYSPIWAPVQVAGFPETENHCLQLRDKDPYDYARAVRVFKATPTAQLSFRLRIEKPENGLLEVELADAAGKRPVRLTFGKNAHMAASDGSETQDLGPYPAGEWFKVNLTVDAVTGIYDLAVDGKKLVAGANLAKAVQTVERLSLRTGEYRTLPTRKTPNQKPCAPLPGADEPVQEAVFLVDDVVIE